jgi:hypothetical protein
MRQKQMLRCFVPLLGLALLAIFAALYIIDRKLYYPALATIEGTRPYKYPFLDWEYIGANIKCWHKGIDVYIANPCDVLHRTFDFSPLWLRLGFIPTGKAWTMPIGLVLVFGYLISVFWLVKPVNRRELIVFALAFTSPMIFFLLERGNVDIIIFIMLVITGTLGTGSPTSRVFSYVLMLLAGLLKFYPVVVFWTALRERPRMFFAIAAGAGLIVIGFFYRFRAELAAALGNLPNGGFGSVNLPFDGTDYALQLFPALGKFAWVAVLPYVIMTLLLMITVVQVVHLTRSGDLVSAFEKLPERDSIFLIIGAALIAGCFFTGVSNGYRGVHLIFVVAGLMAMRRIADDSATRATLDQTLTIILVLMWETFLRQALPHKIPGPGLPDVSLVASALFWFIREVLWWRLAAVLLAMLAIFGVKSELFAALQQWRRIT